jgi:hypothetical protein
MFRFIAYLAMFIVLGIIISANLVDLALAAQSKPVDPVKVLAVIKARMDSRIAYASAPGGGIGNPQALAPWQASGFTSAESYCLARDKEYRLLYDIIQEASK